jgi:hypothetical protein
MVSALREASAEATKVPARCCSVSEGSAARVPRFSFLGVVGQAALQGFEGHGKLLWVGKGKREAGY